jgi:predicted hydrocarbon binding protein
MELQAPTAFEWDNLGDIMLGRGNLGPEMPVLVYRLVQYTMKEILVREYGKETAADLFRRAGHLAGLQFAQNCLELTGDFDFFIAHLQQKLKELKIGILRVERSDSERREFTLTISEDLDCSGLPVTDETVCDFDEGFIAGIFEAYAGTKFNARETDCWASGDRTCRFNVRAIADYPA